MMLDASLTFNTAFATADAIGASGSGNFAGVIDVTGAGVGNKPNMINSTPASGYQTLFSDIGSGDGMAIPWVVISVVQVFNTLTSLTLILESAPDNGTTNNPGTYTNIYQSEAILLASLTAGAYFRFQVPPRIINGQPGQALPRFYRLAYTVGGSNPTTGTMLANITINPFNGLVNTLYNENFVSA